VLAVPVFPQRLQVLLFIAPAVALVAQFLMGQQLRLVAWVGAAVIP